jgi:chitinase|tara:strand:- start:1110 stop:1349 length:240 start_codon:yes stop_codon:yes gene_type:complete
MGNLVTFPFQEKEGKFFAPISSNEPDYIVVNGAIQANGNKIVAGIKGAYATIKLKLPSANATTKKELFALNAEAVASSS